MTEATGILDHPFLEKGIEPRLFQQTILNTCISQNTLVVLPTGTGKTMISILHLAYLLQKGTFNEKGHYALILAPTKPLVHQHFNSFQTFLKMSKGEIVELSGAITPDVREELEKKAKVIIATPQTIKNDIVQGRLDLAKCQLVYFDEAHRATGDYDYVHIADILQQYNPDTRIIALTASPGTKREEIVEICRNLFIQAIESRTKDDPEIQQYIQETIIERMEVPLPFEFEEILEIIRRLGERELQILRKHQLTNKPFHFLYKGELLRIKKQLSLNFRANFFAIMACNRLLYIIILREALESQGIPSAYTLITNWQKKNSKSIKGLLNLEDFNIMIKKIEELRKKGVVHPKLLFLYDILDTVDLINSRVLVFCNLRATCYAISNALAEGGIDAKPFVGQGSGSKKGLTQKKQLELLKAFREDQFPVLVSTSVLEEGLDVEECNLVIFYDGTASAIRKIQRVGRTGRKKKGKVIVLTTHHTIDTTAHYVSSAKERQMKKLLQDTNWLEKELEKKPETEQRAFAPKSTNQSLEKEKMAVEKEPNEQIPIAIGKKSEDKKAKKKKQQSMIEIIVDSREKNSKLLFYLKKEGIELEFKQINCGDYILSDRVAVEYKKGKDLLSSIIDGRLFEQLGLLTNAYQIPLLIIEGFPSGGIHPEAIAGALASFMVDFGVSIIQTQNSEETAAILRRLAIREQKNKKRKVQIRKSYRMANPIEPAIQIIGSFPGINRTLATRLLQELGSVHKVITASEEELQQIDGMGPKKSKGLLEIIDLDCSE